MTLGSLSSYHDKIAPPIATSMPKRHSGKRPFSNQKDSSVVIISPPVKRRVKTVQVFANLKEKQTIKYYEVFLLKTYLSSTLMKTCVYQQTIKYLIKLNLKAATGVKNVFQTIHVYLTLTQNRLMDFTMK